MQAAADRGGANPPERSADEVGSEARRARADFAAAVDPMGRGAPRRSALLQAFFTANAGRSLLPGGESSGALSPQLKPEEP